MWVWVRACVGNPDRCRLLRPRGTPSTPALWKRTQPWESGRGITGDGRDTVPEPRCLESGRAGVESRVTVPMRCRNPGVPWRQAWRLKRSASTSRTMRPVCGESCGRKIPQTCTSEVALPRNLRGSSSHTSARIFLVNYEPKPYLISKVHPLPYLSSNLFCCPYLTK